MLAGARDQRDLTTGFRTCLGARSGVARVTVSGASHPGSPSGRRRRRGRVEVSRSGTVRYGPFPALTAPAYKTPYVACCDVCARREYGAKRAHRCPHDLRFEAATELAPAVGWDGRASAPHPAAAPAAGNHAERAAAARAAAVARLARRVEAWTSRVREVPHFDLPDVEPPSAPAQSAPAQAGTSHQG